MIIAAFFDLDGTLLGPPSLERRFLRYMRWRGELTAAHGAQWLLEFSRRVWSDPFGAAHGNKAHLAGVRAATIETFRASLSRHPLAFFPEALVRQEWHRAQGHKVFLVSGTLQLLAEVVCLQLPVEVTPCATELEIVQGRWTGKVLGEPVCGPGKAHVVARLASAQRLDLGSSFVYGNSWGDRSMLESVGHPAAVNPSALLERLAHQRGWPIVRWRGKQLPQAHGGAKAETPRPSQEEFQSCSKRCDLWIGE
jgi:putative phosphoserine phosphatase/1-acylglycerol-3-phosphate O-acyltransferase